MKPRKECSVPSCHTLIDYDKRYCDRHQGYGSKQYNKHRQREQHDYLQFYHSKEWKRAREQQLVHQPLCEECLRHQHITQATTVHHIVETKVDWSRRLDSSNLESICKSCHEKIYKGRWYGQ